MLRILPAISSILLILAFPGFNLSILAWVGLIPLFFAIDGKSPLKAFKVSYLAGVLFFMGTIYWLMHVTLPGMIGVVLYLALYFGLFGLIAYVAISRASYLSLFVIPSAWVALEYARSHLLGGFGWNLLAHSQSYNLPMIQIADIAGAYGVSFLIVLANTAVFFTIKDIRRKNYSTFYAAVALTLIFISAGYGVLRVNNVFAGHRLKIAVLQGNIAQHKKWDPAFRKSIMDKYITLTLEAAKEQPDLIVWPETSVPGFLVAERDLMDSTSSLARSAGAPLLVGTIREEEDGGNAYYNSASLLGKDGDIEASYDKLHLVPFGEFIPARWLFSFVEKFTKSTIGDFSPGNEYTVFDIIMERGAGGAEYRWKLIKKARFSVLICFEDVFPEIARQFVKNGANFLINITNDAWFGNTSAAYQHAQSSVFRAIENRVNVVRAANTGLSCIIDQKGKIISVVESGGKNLFVDGFVIGEIVLTRTRTFYNKYGDIFSYICMLIITIYVIGRLFIDLFRF